MTHILAMLRPCFHIVSALLLALFLAGCATSPQATAPSLDEKSEAESAKAPKAGQGTPRIERQKLSIEQPGAPAVSEAERPAPAPAPAAMDMAIVPTDAMRQADSSTIVEETVETDQLAAKNLSLGDTLQRRVSPGSPRAPLASNVVPLKKSTKAARSTAGEKMPPPKAKQQASALSFGSVDEVWVFQRPATTGLGLGRGQKAPLLTATTPNNSIPTPLRLLNTTVRAHVVEQFSKVEHRHVFANPFTEPIELSYAFPLPADAAVTHFLMQIGTRTIRGIIRPREDAAVIYRAAKEQGYTAALLSQDADRLFRQRVANVQPGTEVSIQMNYLHRLAKNDGRYHLIIPIQESLNTDIHVEVASSQAILSVDNPAQEIVTESAGPGMMTARLASSQPPFKGDFHLRIRLEEKERSSVLYRDEQQFLAVVHLPAGTVLTNTVKHVALDWQGQQVRDVLLPPHAELVPGQSMLITGRCEGKTPNHVRLSGVASGKNADYFIPLTEPHANRQIDSLSQIIACQRLHHLNEHQRTAPTAHTIQQLTDLSVAEQVLCPGTALLIVDSASPIDRE